MSDANQQTIQSYEGHVQEYISGTPQEVSGVVKDWLDEAVTGLPKDARILELGSATGRDAVYLQNLGYAVDCTDATQAFVDLLNQKGFTARKLNAITDDLGGPYDFVLANAVLLHFTREEMKQVLHKVLAVLNKDGRFAFTLKQGDGEGWSEEKLGAPRFFCYWAEGQIREYMKEAGFTNIRVAGGKATTNALWLQVVARK